MIAWIFVVVEIIVVGARIDVDIKHIIEVKTTKSKLSGGVYTRIEPSIIIVPIIYYLGLKIELFQNAIAAV